MKKINLVLGLIFLYSILNAQVWYFGNQAAIDFSSGTAVSVNSGQQMFTAEGCTMAYDNNCNLLFYTDGDTIWDRNNAIVATGLMGSSTSTQSAIAVPAPGKNFNEFWIFTIGEGNGTNGLRSTYIINCLSTPTVPPLTMNVLLSPAGGNTARMTEKLCAFEYSTGDFWILAHGFTTPNVSTLGCNFYAYHLQSNNTLITNPVISTVGMEYSSANGMANTQGQMKFSHDGNQIALATMNLRRVEIFNFTNGFVTNPRRIQFPYINGTGSCNDCEIYGLEFSPNNQYLYIGGVYNCGCNNSNHRIYQVNLSTFTFSTPVTNFCGSIYNERIFTDTTDILTATTQIKIIHNTAIQINYGQLQLAPDGNIYVARTTGTAGSWVSRIENPDSPSASFNDKAIQLLSGQQCLYGLPTLMGNIWNCNCWAEKSPLYTKIRANTNPPITAPYTFWDGKYYIDDNVIVQVNGGCLDITNVDVVFGECAGINFTAGGYLRANNSVFRPCYIDNAWRGLHFMGVSHDSTLINECTFKNAKVALYFDTTTDAVISNNLFSNCNYGIKVNSNINFNHPISGNRFVTEQFFPHFGFCPNDNYTFVHDTSTYGIYSTATWFKHQLSQNEFLNSMGNNTPRTYGIFLHSSGAVISGNRFTDMYNSVFLQNQLRYSCIENNDIDANVPVIIPFSSIYIANCLESMVEVNNNKIWNNYNWEVSRDAILSYNSNVSILGNQINSFYDGIHASRNRKCLISSNKIVDCADKGIFIDGLYEYRSYITCNSITMNNYGSWSAGLYGINLTGYSPSVPQSIFSEVSSNCITDSYIPMKFGRTTLIPGKKPLLPKIRNNFLYNYTAAGIFDDNLGGNIGVWPGDPGLNTLWSNKNTAVDIFSNTAINVADNFGMFYISAPVKITHNDPYHSTASCAHQIFNMPSQGQLNVDYSCDHFKSFWPYIVRNGATFSLSSNYRELLRASSDQFNDANMILATAENSDPALLNEIEGLITLSENEKALLEYSFYKRNGDYLNAKLHLEHFTPTTADEDDYKTLRLYDLKIAKSGVGSLSENDIGKLRNIQGKTPELANYATTILNSFSTYNDYKTEVIEMKDAVISGEIRHIESDQSNLKIYPNPFSTRVFIELINTNSATSKIEVFDIVGKLVTEYTINFVAGGIELDMQKLEEGIYIIALTDPTSGFLQKGKLIKVDD